MAREVKAVNVDVEVWKRVDELASAQNLSRSEYVEKLLREGIQGDELTVKVMTDPVLVPAMSKAFADPSVMRALLAVMRENKDVGQQELDFFLESMESAKKKLVGQAKSKQSAQVRPRGPRQRRRHK